MLAFILRRSIQTAIVMVAVASFAFLLPHVGDAVVFPPGQDAQPEQMAAHLFLIALNFVIINSVADLLHFAADPRLRVGSAKGH